MKIRLIFLAVVGLVGALVYGAIQNSATNSPPPSTPVSTAIATSTAKIPLYDHIFVIIEENKAYEQIIGNPHAPVINELARTYGLASNYYGIVHPSEGNYVAILGGSTFGIHDDAPFDADVNTPGSHGVNHTIASRSLICPNLDRLIATGDARVGETVRQITNSPLWKSTKNNAIVITWDEDDGSTKSTPGCCGFDPKSQANFGGGRIATIVITNHGARGLVDPTPYNHYSLLRTTEEAFGISEYLNFANRTQEGIKSLTPLFAVDR